MAGGSYNVNQAAADGQQAAMGGTFAGMGYNGQDVGQHMNPYTTGVIDAAQGDLERQRQMTMNQVGADATAAGAFGGSRHGIMEAETNRAFADAGAQMAAGLRHQGFTTAQDASRSNAALRLGAAGHMGDQAGQAFNMGRAINADLMSQGAMQQGLMQQILDGANQQYAGWSGAPQQALQLPLQAVGMSPHSTTTSGTTKSTSTPGLMDYVSAGASLFGFI